MSDTCEELPTAPLLSEAHQVRNILIFAGCTALQYLAAPVLYVGIAQGSLLNGLGASRTVANLPETAFFVLTVTPVFLAWLLPGVQYLKRTLAGCYLAAAAAMAVVALTLPAGVQIPGWVKVAAVILQGAVTGAAMPTAIALLWEAVGRGISPERRGLALGLAFGAGPLLAVVGSLGQQLILDGKVFGWSLSPAPFPGNFVILFQMGIPVMLLAAALSLGLVVPPDEERPAPVLLSGLVDFLSSRILLWATVVTILLYIGNTITANMNLYTRQALAADPASYGGYQQAIRFGCKVLAGAFLGWVLARTSPRAGILATGALFVLSQVWAMFATGPAYLWAFGIYGAGELVGVYAPNYILAASPARDMRRNMAYVTMMMAPAAPMGTLFGYIADRGKSLWGETAAFQASFALCALILLAGLALAVLKLPARPAAPERTP